MEDIEDFKYEFDLAYFHYYPEYNNIPEIIINGYLCLHQFVLQDLSRMIDKDNILWVIKTQLEEGETIEEIADGEYEIKINNICDETLDYIKFLLKYTLIKIKNLMVKDNNITFEIDNEDMYQRK